MMNKPFPEDTWKAQLYRLFFFLSFNTTLSGLAGLPAAIHALNDRGGLGRL